MRLFDLANRIAIKLAEEGPDNSLGRSIPATTAHYLKNRIVNTYNLMLNGAFGELVKLYSPSLPDLTAAEDMMVALVNATDDLSLKDVAKSATAVLGSLARIRSSLYDNIPHFAMAKKVDELLKRVQDHLWKDTKRIYSCPELKGTPIYTWNEGPGSNPVKPVRTFPKSHEKVQRQNLMNPSPNQAFIDAYNKHQEKEKRVSTFEEYEALLDKEML